MNRDLWQNLTAFHNEITHRGGSHWGTATRGMNFRDKWLGLKGIVFFEIWLVLKLFNYCHRGSHQCIETGCPNNEKHNDHQENNVFQDFIQLIIICLLKHWKVFILWERKQYHKLYFSIRESCKEYNNSNI